MPSKKMFCFWQGAVVKTIFTFLLKQTKIPSEIHETTVVKILMSSTKGK